MDKRVVAPAVLVGTAIGLSAGIMTGMILTPEPGAPPPVVKTVTKTVYVPKVETKTVYKFIEIPIVDSHLVTKTNYVSTPVQFPDSCTSAMNLLSGLDAPLSDMNEVIGLYPLLISQIKEGLAVSDFKSLDIEYSKIVGYKDRLGTASINLADLSPQIESEVAKCKQDLDSLQ